MSVAVGDIVEGKITGITKFGAFVSLPGGDNGLVHISEISNDYVEKVEDYVEKGQTVKVKVLSVEKGKISLSMKALEKKKPRTSRPKNRTQPVEVDWQKENTNRHMSFEDQLSQFLKDSGERHDQLRSRDVKRGNGQR